MSPVGADADEFPFLLGHEAAGVVEAHRTVTRAGYRSFAEKTLVHSGQCTKVNPAIAPEVAGLLGYGVMAGLRAAINTLAAVPTPKLTVPGIPCWSSSAGLAR